MGIIEIKSQKWGGLGGSDGTGPVESGGKWLGEPSWARPHGPEGHAKGFGTEAGCFEVLSRH